MAEVRIADIYNPLVFNATVDEKAIELNRFLASGVMVSSPKLADMIDVGGNIGELPFHNPLDSSNEPDYVTDNPAETSTPDKIDTDKMNYRVAYMHKSWSTMDLARELALMDPLTAITSKIGGWWATQIEKRLINTALGILADNEANDSGDMVVDIATDAVGAPSADELISASAVIDAAQTMGDHAEALSVIAMHSVVYSNLKKQNLIDTIPNARGEVQFETYLGYIVVVDDSMPAVAGTNRITYTSILFAIGAVDYAPGNPSVPSELDRVPAAGKGGGQDIIHSRKTNVIHPFGFTWTDASVAGQTATLAELANATNWNRVRQRKNIGIAFLKTNG